MTRHIGEVLEERFALVPQAFRCTECGASWEGQTVRHEATADPQDRFCDVCAAKRLEDRRRRDVARWERQQRARALENLAIPPLYEQADFETFALHGDEATKQLQQRALTVARRWVSLWPDCVMLQVWCGGPGTGKGHLVWSVARALASERGIAARVVKLADLIRELRASWRDRDQPSEDDVLRDYRALDWLAIDEVSGHAFRGEPKQHLYDVVDHRLEHNRPTLLTTNESADALGTLLGPALVSRINGAGGVIDFGAADYRSRDR